MASILDKPMIYHMVERLRSIKQVSGVVIDTFSDSTNISLCNYAKSENISYYA
jgi:spore coat polysaccharide biosynthesis protein SpsF (cytidylyltransferase family)